MWNKEHNSIYDYTSSDLINKRLEITYSILFTKRKDQLKHYKINSYPLDYKEESLFDYFSKYMNNDVINEICVNDEEILTEIHFDNENDILDKYKVISQNKSIYFQYMKIQYHKEQGFYSNYANWICIGKSELIGNESLKMKKSLISENEEYNNSSILQKSCYNLFAGDIIKMGKVMFKIVEINSSLRPNDLNSYNKKLSNHNFTRENMLKCKEIEELSLMIQETLNPKLKIKSNHIKSRNNTHNNKAKNRSFDHRKLNKSLNIDKKYKSFMIENSFNSFGIDDIEKSELDGNEEQKSSVENLKTSDNNENDKSSSQNHDQTYDFIIENPNKSEKKLSLNSKSKIKSVNLEEEFKSNTNLMLNDSNDLNNEKNNIVLQNNELISKVQTSNNIPKIIPKKKKKKKNIEEEIAEVPTCRICFGLTEHLNPLICCCRCLGSVRYTHLECLRDWIKSKLIVSTYRKLIVVSKTVQNCEICKFPYPMKVKVGQSIEYLYNFERPERNGDHYIIMEGFSFDNQKATNWYIISFDNSSDSISFGRSNNSDIRLSCTSVSRMHSKMTLDNNGSILLEDESSKFGTLVLLTNEIKLIPVNKLLLQSNNTLFEFNLNKQSTLCYQMFRCFFKSNHSLYSQTYSDYIVKQKRLLKEIIPESNFFNVSDYKEFDKLKEQLLNLKELKKDKENIKKQDNIDKKSPKKKTKNEVNDISYLDEYQFIYNNEENINMNYIS